MMNLTIGWLYFDLMNTYGDRGNVLTLKNRAQKRNIAVTIKSLTTTCTPMDIQTCDLLFMGGAEDWQQEIVSKDLQGEKKQVFTHMIEDHIPGLFICGAYQFLGEYYLTADKKKLPGLNIIPIYTQQSTQTSKRLIGDIVCEVTHPALLKYIPSKQDRLLIGFENHGGRTMLLDKKNALSRTISGYGNNDSDATEGSVYNNTIATYMHGPLLPRNPVIADFLIAKALTVKYNHEVELTPLDDTVITNNRTYLLKKMYDSRA
ncbi:MAG: cobalamin biosynthesis protein CobQ [Candidatus Roizmanbacteria bacterium]|nr:cobalamin biosynthesis protein CobQ [Candidatus Roizmanbacteria bacterium]